LLKEAGLSVGLDNGELYFTLAGMVHKGSTANDGLFHPTQISTTEYLSR
jgi:hypothetical protein